MLLTLISSHLVLTVRLALGCIGTGKTTLQCLSRHKQADSTYNALESLFSLV